MTKEELKCVADELLQGAYEFTTQGNCHIEREEVISKAKYSLGLDITDEEIETVFSMIEDETEFLLDADYDGQEIDIMIAYNRALNGLYFLKGEEDEEKRYHEFLKGYEKFERAYPMEWDYFEKKLELPIKKDGKTSVTALTETQAWKIYQDVVVGDILNDKGQIKSEYIDEIETRKQERKKLAWKVIEKCGVCGINHPYVLLGRMVSDNDYYINRGHSEKHLWAGDIVRQTEYMKALYLRFDDEERPEWLNLHDIVEYQKKMSRVSFDEGIKTAVEDFLKLNAETFPYDWDDYCWLNDAFVEKMKNDIRQEIICADDDAMINFISYRLREPFEECDEETKKEAMRIRINFLSLYEQKKQFRILFNDEPEEKNELDVENERIEDLVDEDEEIEKDYDLEL